MKKIEIVFPDKSKISAAVLTEQEPDLAADLREKLSGPVELICDHAVSAGQIFDAYIRPAAEPAACPLGKNPVSFSELVPGDVLWDGEKLSVVYGDVPQPGEAGCVVAKIDADPAFQKACMNIWYDIYREHTGSVITVSWVDAG